MQFFQTHRPPGYKLRPTGLDIPADCSKYRIFPTTDCFGFNSIDQTFEFYPFAFLTASFTEILFDPAACFGPWSLSTLSATIDIVWKYEGDWLQNNPVDYHIGVGSRLHLSLARQYHFVLLQFLRFQHCSRFLTWILVNALLLATALELSFRRSGLQSKTLNQYQLTDFISSSLRSTRPSRHKVHSGRQTLLHLSALTAAEQTQPRKPGPKSGRAVRRVLLGILILWMAQMDFQSMWTSDQLHGGEGCGIQPWDSMEASFDAQKLSHLLEAKTHGQPPTVGSGPVRFPTTMRTMTPIQKRSFIRAYARSLRDGIAWYQGKCMSPEDFPAHMPHPTQPRPSRPAGVPPTQPAKRTLTHRLNVIQYNVGGLSSHKLEEIQQWGLQVDADLVILLETRWGFSSEWSTPAWHVLHSGSSEDKADGILILLRTKTIHSSQIGSVAVMPGRLVHVRIHYRQRACDLICCYNFMDDRSTARMQQRHQFWAALDKCVGSLPNRNSMLIAGDMNCSLAADDVHVGTAAFTWQARHHHGPQHKDMHLFQKLLRKHHLTALNGWNASNGPTFHNELMASRIDFFPDAGFRIRRNIQRCEIFDTR